MNAPKPVLCPKGRRLLGDADRSLKDEGVGMASGLMLINRWGDHTRGCERCNVGPADLVARGAKRAFGWPW